MTGEQLTPDEAYWRSARATLGDQVTHVTVIPSLRQMRVQLVDGSRLLLDEHGEQIGRTLPPPGDG